MAVDQERSKPDVMPTKAKPPGVSLLMTLPRRILSVARFEFRRSITPARLAAWLVLALFPVVIMGIVSLYEGPNEPWAWGIMLYGLVPQVVCALGLLLWVAPLVHSELEGRTWFYLTSRPGGRVAMLLGKYLNGVVWSATAGCVGVTLAMIVAAAGIHNSFEKQLADIEPSVFIEEMTGDALPEMQATESDSAFTLMLRLWWTMLALVGLCCLAYGAAFTVMAVIFPRRAMMISVAYMLVVEVLMGNMPAVVNQLTVHHRLINLLWRSMQWPIPDDVTLTLDPTAAWIHLVVLASYTLGLLMIAAAILCRREYITSDQS